MKQSLNFKWLFLPDFKEEYLSSLPKDCQEIDIPHCAKEVPYNYFDEKDYQLISTYQKTFDVEENINNKVIELVFDGYMLKARIYLNGVDFGEQGATRFSITAASTGACTITLRLDSQDGPVIGTAVIPRTGSAEKYRTFSTKVSNASGVHDLYLCFSNTSGDTRLDWWQFK